MDILEGYRRLSYLVPPKKPITEIPPPTPVPPLYLEDQTKQATQPVMSSVLRVLTTVHNVSDYRRTSTSIQLIPLVDAEIDKLLFDPKEGAACSITL